VDVERLMDQEEESFRLLWTEIDRLTDEQLERPGVTPDGWSVKDVMFHVAAWAADCGLQFERMHAGTWVRPEEDVDGQNREWFELSRTLELRVVRAELTAARTRMVVEFGTLPEVTPDAWEWFEESGPLHYASHLVDVRCWDRA
jgi:hypothetical protein